MLEALTLPFFQRVLLAGLLASVACGIIGSYVVAKRIASISGGISHAAFGGRGARLPHRHPPDARGRRASACWPALVVGLA